MTATEINAYLNAADPKWCVALLLSVTSPLRIRETLGLRERDLDLEKGQLHVHQALAKVDDGVIRLTPLSRCRSMSTGGYGRTSHV